MKEYKLENVILNDDGVIFGEIKLYPSKIGEIKYIREPSIFSKGKILIEGDYGKNKIEAYYTKQDKEFLLKWEKALREYQDIFKKGTWEVPYSYYYPVKDNISNDILYIDIETTGLSIKRDEILQLSIIDGNGKVLFNKYSKPLHRREWKEAEAINNISKEKVANEKNLEVFYNEIQDIFDRAKVVIVYNADFDIPFLQQVGFDFDKVKVIDAMYMFSVMHSKYDFQKEMYTPKKLIVAARYYDYSFNPHDSLEDVKATKYIYERMFDEIAAKEKSIDELEGWFDRI